MKTEALPSSTPGFVVNGKERSVQLLKHVGDTLIALMAAADVSFADSVWPILPSISSSSQDHQSQQPRRRETERFTFDELNFDDAAGLGRIRLLALRLQSCRNAHGTARSYFLQVLFNSFGYLASFTFHAIFRSERDSRDWIAA